MTPTKIVPNYSAFRKQNYTVSKTHGNCERRPHHLRPLHITLLLLCGEQRAQDAAREVLGNNRRQSQQSRLELGAACQRLIAKGEQSGLRTHIATMGSVSLCARMKS
jgi:hypothetical protein